VKQIVGAAPVAARLSSEINLKIERAGTGPAPTCLCRMNSALPVLIKAFLGHIFERIFDQHIDDGQKVVAAVFFIDFQLFVGGSAAV
jgi:hypothetical protein